MRITTTLGFLTFATLSTPSLATVDSTLGMVTGQRALSNASIQIDYAAELNSRMAAQPYVISSESALRARNEQRLGQQVDRLMAKFGMDVPASAPVSVALPMPVSWSPVLELAGSGCSVQAPEPFWSISDLSLGPVETAGCETHDCVYL